MQFDWRYLHGRSLICVDDLTGEPTMMLNQLGRMREGGGELVERELNSGAYGQNKFTTLSTPGILQVDVIQYLRKEVKLESYSLNAVAQKYLGDTKLDLPAWQIFDKFEGSSADRAVIAEYAAKDTVLPLQLMSKLCVFENLSEMANATYCPLNYVLQRGQQIKVYSVLMKKARGMGYVCPDNVGIGVTGKFTGATVLNADRGAYFDIVSGLDFASRERHVGSVMPPHAASHHLTPPHTTVRPLPPCMQCTLQSFGAWGEVFRVQRKAQCHRAVGRSLTRVSCVCRAWALDYSTIVLDPKYDNLPGVEYYDVESDQGKFRFAQGFSGVLPELLKDLAAFRKAAKTKMAEAKARGDTFAVAVHNG